MEIKASALLGCERGKIRNKEKKSEIDHWLGACSPIERRVQLGVRKLISRMQVPLEGETSSHTRATSSAQKLLNLCHRSRSIKFSVYENENKTFSLHFPSVRHVSSPFADSNSVKLSLFIIIKREV
jgi:hypothetical protein